MLVTINTPKVQAPFGVSLLHPVLIVQGYLLISLRPSAN